MYCSYLLLQVSSSVRPEEFNTSDCGSTKGCMFYPRYCSGGDCGWVVMYKTLPDYSAVDFQIIAKAAGYATVGFSHDQLMVNTFRMSYMDRRG